MTEANHTRGRLRRGRGGSAGVLSWLPFGKRGALVGLDIGTSMIKTLILDRRGDAVNLQHLALAPTPEEALCDGRATDGLTISYRLHSLWKEYRIRTKQVAIAATGDSVHAQSETLPMGFGGDVGEFIRTSAEKALPYPLDKAALDFEHLGAVSENATQDSVLWVGAALEQVEWCQEVVALSGRVAAMVDAQACALANAYIFNHQPEPNDAVLLLHVGARSMVFALMHGDKLLFSRESFLGGSVVESEDLAESVIQVLDQHWATLSELSSSAGVDRILLSGGAARSPDLKDRVNSRFGLGVEELNPFRRIQYAPAGDSGKLIDEHGPALSVVVGLALRSFDDL